METDQNIYIYIYIYKDIYWLIQKIKPANMYCTVCLEKWPQLFPFLLRRINIYV